MLSYVIPTRDRAHRLAATLAALGRLDEAIHAPLDGAEVVVVDNGSAPPTVTPQRLANGIEVTLVRRDRNDGAAGRNAGVEAARGAWVFMLDDDSHPTGAISLAPLVEAGPEVVAIGAEIRLPSGRREAGGLPEVFVGCGVAIRRDAFRAAGGYDPSFGYYVEEYDLCARLLAAGGRVTHDDRLRIVHHRAAAGRDMNEILFRLVRNNGWVAQRYAPATHLEAAHARSIERCREIALVEGAEAGFERGRAALEATLDEQPRRPLEDLVHDRFIGAAAVRAVAEDADVAGRRIALVHEAKNAWVIGDTLRAAGAALVTDARDADLIAIGTLSPGPARDAWDARHRHPRPCLPPWLDHCTGRPTPHPR